MLGDLPPLATTGVGSLPFADPGQAMAHVTAGYDVPFCPQLPLLEGDMVAEWLGADPRRCGWSPERDRERPRAWEVFLRSLREFPPSHGVAKLQVTGPLTLALALEASGQGEPDHAAALELAREVAGWLAATAGQQVRAVADLGLTPLLMVDEPALAALAPEPARAAAVWDPLRVSAPAWGLHVCCRVPWDVVGHAAPDVISLDSSAGSGDNGAGCLDRASATGLERQLRRGGRVMWGALPVDTGHGAAEASDRMAHALAVLGARGIERERVLRQSLLSPACGSALVSERRERELAPALRAVSQAAVLQLDLALPHHR